MTRLLCSRFTLQLMAAASKFGLGALVDKCEEALVSSVSVSNCIRYVRDSCDGRQKL